LQLVQHIVDNQAQTDAATSTSIHQQGQNFNHKHAKSDIDAQNYEHTSTANLI
jgi:hypothetical protein